MKIGFIGAGKMAEGILQAMISEAVRPDDILMAERNSERAKEMSDRYGVTVLEDANLVTRRTSLIFLAVRPQDVQSVADTIRNSLTERKLLVSIVAGKTIAKLRKAFGGKVRIVRVMPNLALRVKEGMCAICGAKNAKPTDVKQVSKLLGAAGEVVVLAERHFDAVTALSGSGPAFYAYMEKAMMAGGAALGLPMEVARKLAEQTMLGTVRYLKSASADLDEFISGVSTKGGTTAAGMEVLQNSKLNDIVAKTLAAAAKRSHELA